LLVDERPVGYLKAVAAGRSGLLHAAGSLVDYVIGDPLHFAMVRKMMLGLKARAEGSAGPGSMTGPPGDGCS
jgi:hypothetical protein